MDARGECSKVGKDTRAKVYVYCHVQTPVCYSGAGWWYDG